jgi:hypothetical protein
MELLEIELGGLNWIGLPQDGYRCRALVNSVKNFGFNKMLGIYRVAAQLVTSPMVLSSTELVSWFHGNYLTTFAVFYYEALSLPC